VVLLSIFNSADLKICVRVFSR